MRLLTVRYEEGGLRLPRLGLGLDLPRRRAGAERVFISHAHTDHLGAHGEVILTAPTARFMQARLGGQRRQHVLAFGVPAQFDGPDSAYRVTLHPAGHILGSAMALVEAGGESLLYTGDFKLRPGLAAEPCQPLRAEVLLMETTFGRPEFRFPPAEQVWARIVEFCRDTLAAGKTPVLLGYSLGKSQELLCGLGRASLPVMLHPRVHELTKLFAELGQRLPPYEAFAPNAARGKVLLLPTGASAGKWLGEVGPVRTAVCTGWALEPSCRFRYGTDAAFPLSDHADFAELLELVEGVAPKRVLTVHGFAADFAQSLRDLGWDAHALSEADQLALPLKL